MATSCPDDGCHDKVLDHQQRIYGEKGILDDITGIKLCLKDTVSKKGVWLVIGSSLFLFVLVFSVFTSMWAETRRLPEDRKEAAQRENRLTRLEEQSKAMDSKIDLILSISRTTLDEVKKNGGP